MSSTMVFLPTEIKQDPERRWNLPDDVFFAAGACHILAFAFLEKHSHLNFYPLWIKPSQGQKGNHIFVTDGHLAFDFRGFKPLEDFIGNLEKEMKSLFSDWNYQLIRLPKKALVSEQESKTYEGLWLREPDQFLKNALPRAHRFLGNFEFSEPYWQKNCYSSIY